MNQFPRNDWLGLKQAGGVLLVAALTGTATFLLWRAGYWFAALLAWIAHGNVCSLFISGVHELAHKTVFKTRWLNAVFSDIYGFLNWMDCRTYMHTHSGHHQSTLHHDDPELPGACRPLWWGTWIWNAFFNLPRFVSGLKNPRLLEHAALAAAFILSGYWELIILINLAPFFWGWVEILVTYPQHAGLNLDAPHDRERTRSLVLPGWLSFLHWRMEYHLDHHLHPNVPCYHLPALRASLTHLPPRETLLEAWAYIVLHRTPGHCGHGLNPFRRLLGKLALALPLLVLCGCASESVQSRAMRPRLIPTTGYHRSAVVAPSPTIPLWWDNPNPREQDRYCLTEFHSTTNLLTPFKFKAALWNTNHVVFPATNAAEYFICRFLYTNTWPWQLSWWNTKTP